MPSWSDKMCVDLSDCSQQVAMIDQTHWTLTLLQLNRAACHDDGEHILSINKSTRDWNKQYFMVTSAKEVLFSVSFVGLFVCEQDNDKKKKDWPDSHETWRKRVAWAKEEPITFWSGYTYYLSFFNITK